MEFGGRKHPFGSPFLASGTAKNMLLVAVSIQSALQNTIIKLLETMLQEHRSYASTKPKHGLSLAEHSQ